MLRDSIQRDRKLLIGNKCWGADSESQALIQHYIANAEGSENSDTDSMLRDQPENSENY